MKHRSHKLKALILASCMTAMPMAGTYVFAQSDAGTSTTTVHRKHVRKAAPRKSPGVESQIREMREQFNQQQQEIDALKQQLQSRDQQLQQAQDAAQQAQQTAAQAQQAASQTTTQNNAAYTNLQQAVQGIQADSDQSKQTLATVEKDQKRLKRAVLHPDDFAYKGITISPNGSFIEAATVFRTGATGGGINTQFTGIPLDHSDDAQISEFQGSGRQSRIALKATGKLDSVTLTGYYEMDWLGSGITSNNNQSNSYVVRQRQLWARAAMNNGWTVAAGQMWSLATETTQGETNGTEVLPSTIDPQYNAGFVWTRQYGFRVTKDINHKIWMGASAENAETLNPAGSGLPTNLVIGSAGNNGGLYNVNANYSFNRAPDMLAKVVIEPGWGHYEIFGISRFFRDRIYPNAGAKTPSATGAYNDTTVGGGIGGGFRVPVAHNKLTVGLKGLYGMGVGRYGSSTIADITLHPDAQIAPLRAFSSLATIEANPTGRLNVYFNYGGDYVYRRYFGSEGYGSLSTNMSGCNVEPVPGTAAVNGATGFSPSTPANCGNQNKDVQEGTVGYWFNIVNGPKGKLRQGVQYSHFLRELWSGTGGTTNPSNGAQGNDNVIETSLRYYLP
jgi:hypothetical protein